MKIPHLSILFLGVVALKTYLVYGIRDDLVERDLRDDETFVVSRGELYDLVREVYRRSLELRDLDLEARGYYYDDDLYSREGRGGDGYPRDVLGEDGLYRRDPFEGGTFEDLKARGNRQTARKTIPAARKAPKLGQSMQSTQQSQPQQPQRQQPAHRCMMIGDECDTGACAKAVWAKQGCVCWEWDGGGGVQGVWV
ncbi:hypothetical protein CC1G_15238 [Coprinopsis cinerea okayama7|uniref:Uncharacterized protein n=1 Tax=Coprinopsis cinerea (strain Okayama-7 / 130 / ATCC MYA-4618 / FGSC 9003) TaxID=240176 RepID=D6RQ63_COPC7|nr:hypothetical protein CC1G_15238 [Coprinopsis cinerea okayama7\|eukprot:XP_002910330.1 hypothetical protein CC1G_15238 [Coprinopsis cinerea okayama7\